MKRLLSTVLMLGFATLAAVRPASAQSSMTPTRPRPTGRLSMFADAWTNDPDDARGRSFRELITTATFRAPETDGNGVDYGVDLRHSGFSGDVRPQRLSLYEGFVGAKLASGHLRIRGGHLWLTDLGALGSIAGGHVEVRQVPNTTSAFGRWRIGAFGGAEPKVFESGYYPGVKKLGVYGALDGAGARRHTLGYVNVRTRSLTERSVVTTTNFVPVRRVFFLYQAAEYDLAQPAGRARAGLNYFYSNARVNAGTRVELQGTYNRGRSVDTRGLADDVVNGRPITQTAAQGLVYESIGGRMTVEPLRRVRIYVGYSEDKSNREDKAAGRTTLGGYAPNVGRSGFDVSASHTQMSRSSGRYHSEYVSLGRQIGRRAYVSGDYSTSLSIIRFSRSDGLIIEDRPTTKRLSGTGSVVVGPTTSLQITVDRTWDTGVREFRLLSGISYRFR